MWRSPPAPGGRRNICAHRPFPTARSATSWMAPGRSVHLAPRGVVAQWHTHGRSSSPCCPSPPHPTLQLFAHAGHSAWAPVPSSPPGTGPSRAPHPWTGHAAARVSQRDLCTECFPDGFPSASLCLQSCGHLFAEFVTIRGSRSAAGSLSCVLLSLKCHAAILSQSRRATGAER